MKKTKAGKDFSCEIVPIKNISCDGNNTPEPYLKIITTKRRYATIILEGFKKNMIHEMVIISLDKIFCGAGDIASDK